ncbi:hypothetical protein ACIQI8_27455 [Streptomyces sp. NPDC092369]|uniref:hypothetical protein n=1 Tax=Streptomyces sp. NPDC092369 TaxID=3366015 RepID=UPI0037FEDCC2
MTGIRVSVIDDLPQLAAAGVSLRMQRLADNLGASIGRSLLEGVVYPNLVGMAAEAELQGQLDALKAQVALDRYLNLAACLGVGRDAAHAILAMERAYFRPWVEGPPTDLEIEEADVALRAVSTLVSAAPRAEARPERERLKRLSARATETVARQCAGEQGWPCGCTGRSR